MHTWASTVATRLSALGLDAVAVAPERVASDATHLVLARSHRDVDGAHATISLFVDERHVEVAVQLPLPDVPAARSRLTDPLRALELTTALEALPEQFAIGIVGDDEPAPASRASTDQVRALLVRAEHEQRALWLGWSVSREVAVEHAELLDEQLQDAAVALASVFAMLTSLSDGSKATGGETRRREKRQRNRADEELLATSEMNRGRGTERRARKPGRLREREGDREPEPDPREPAGPPAAMQRTAGGSPPVHIAGRARPGRPTGSAHEIEKGSRVRVLDGPFSGKVGVVQELDGTEGARGARVARVMLGLLAVRVDVRDLARCAEGRARPVLSTSHRKRSAVRS